MIAAFAAALSMALAAAPPTSSGMGQTAAATLVSTWAGEWSLAARKGGGGFLSIRDCVPGQNRCRIIFDTHGRSADDPDKMGGCHFGDPKRPNDEILAASRWAC